MAQLKSKKGGGGASKLVCEAASTYGYLSIVLDRFMSTYRENRSDEPLISVAMPVYNAGQHLHAAVRSIVEQTYVHWELFLVDDGSTDGAVDILPMLSDPRIHVLRDGRNLGLAARLNMVINLAHGEFIARMDGDDISHPERFERQVRALLRYPEIDVVATRCVAISESGRRLGTLPFAQTHAQICSAPWKGFYMPHPTWMGRKRWFRANPYANPAPYCCEDQQLLLNCYQKSRFMALPEELLQYRIKDQISWAKAWRTRSSLRAVQVHHFIAKKQYGWAIFAVFFSMARHIKDLIELRGHFGEIRSKRL